MKKNIYNHVYKEHENNHGIIIKNLKYDLEYFINNMDKLTTYFYKCDNMIYLSFITNDIFNCIDIYKTIYPEKIKNLEYYPILNITSILFNFSNEFKNFIINTIQNILEYHNIFPDTICLNKKDIIKYINIEKEINYQLEKY